MRSFVIFSLLLLAAGVVPAAETMAAQPTGACQQPALECAPHVARPPKPDGPNWIFQPGLYSHDPMTGERTTQYAPLPAIEGLPDTRYIASGYQRSRINQYGTGGSVDTYYRVENWSNVPGGLDAEWERVNDVWQQSTLSGGYGSSGMNFGYGQPYGGYGRGGFGGPGYGNGPGYGPGYGYGPGWGNGPGYGYGGPGYGNGPGYGPGPGYGNQPGYGGGHPGGGYTP